MIKLSLFIFTLVLPSTGILPAPFVVGAEGARDAYVSMCSVCHGEGGKGDGPGASALQPKPADFTDCGAMSGKTDDSLFAIIKRGGTGVGRSNMMPSWGGAIGDEQIGELVAYIRGLCKK
jgi:mono/diheme cytochrome c family protein